jgi:hypothetical protein
MVATKFEEIYPPTAKDFVYITDDAYTKSEILQMEQEILSTLDYNILHNSSLRFLDRYTIVAGSDETETYFARYLLELALLDSKMN